MAKQGPFNALTGVKHLSAQEEVDLFAARDRLLADPDVADALETIERLRAQEKESPSGPARDALKKQIADLEKHKALIPLNRVRDRVILAHYAMAMGLAMREAARYAKEGDQNERREEFVSAALQGLTSAFNKFDPAVGARFSTFAQATIKFFIVAAFRTSCSGGVFGRDETEVGKYIAARYPRLLSAATHKNPDATAYELDLAVAQAVRDHFIARGGKVNTVEYYADRIERYKASRESGKVSLDQPVNAGNPDSEALGAFIADGRDLAESIEDAQELEWAERLLRQFFAEVRQSEFFSAEKERERLERIYEPRFLRRLGNTEELNGERAPGLETLATEFNVSTERVRQLENRAHLQICKMAAEFFPRHGAHIPDVFIPVAPRKRPRKAKVDEWQELLADLVPAGPQ